MFILTLRGQSASLVYGHPSSDGVTIRIPCVVDVLFPIGLVKTESDFIVRSVKIDLSR